jgi:hypothetical protein
MSNPLAVAAVTATLRNLLTTGLATELGSGKVTTKPLDKARDSNTTSNQVNLFLYHVTYDAAWRNMDMPRQIKPGETGHPPLPLILHYLITAYGENDDAQDPVSHHLLGKAMSLLHDHPLLGTAEIKTALNGNDLGDQVERVRITPQLLSLEEMSKLWTIFQTQYRLSAAYQVSVVLIDSQNPSKTPLPVLARGRDDRGIASQADLTPPFPTLTEVSPPNGQPSARLGETLTLTGFHLDSGAGGTVTAQFKHPRLSASIPVPTLAGGTATKASVQLPNAPAHWPCGVYTVSLLIQHPGKEDRVTNELPFALVPSIVPSVTSPLPMSVIRDDSGNATVQLTCSPEVLPEQRAALLMSDREILAQPHLTQTGELTFIITHAPKSPDDGFFIRLRIDGVDSLLVANYKATPPAFDAHQKVKIT